MQIQAGFPPPEEVSGEMAKALKIAQPALDRGMFRLDWDGMIAFAEAGSEAYNHISDGTDEASTNVKNMRIMLERAKLVGVENIVATSSNQTQEAYHIKVDDLSGIEFGQLDESGEFSMNTVSWWIDKEHYVPLAFQMDGETEVDGVLTPISIIGKELDYTRVGTLYESYTKVYQISGIMKAMSKKDQKDMEKAKEDMAKAKEEMAKMTPEQQAMMKKMMGNKFEELEKMMEGDAFETKMKVTGIVINEGPPSMYGLGSADLQPALTHATEEVDAQGSLVGKLEVSVGPLADRELKISLVGNTPFPMPGETMSIAGGSGYVVQNGNKVEISGASGSIIVDYRSETHVRGTYTVDLGYAGGTLPTINGTFKSEAPRGPGQAPLGSPIPIGIFSGTE
jgi:hypothetical protein